MQLGLAQTSISRACPCVGARDEYKKIVGRGAEAASVNAMTAAAESSPEPAALTADEDPTNPEPSLANRGWPPS